jgi:poly-gamma-glutamate synthesis protein (capsule biosynthesis protein)
MSEQDAGDYPGYGADYSQSNSEDIRPPRARDPRDPQVSRRALLAGVGLAGLGAAGLGLADAAGLLGASPPLRHTRELAHLAPTPTPTATPDTRPVSVVITGDVMLARTVTQQILATHDHFPFEHTASFLAGFDLTVGNLECVVSTLGSAIPGKPFTFEATTEGFGRLVDAGFDVVSVANNHSGDYGKDAFMDMLHRLPGYGITPVGGGINAAQAHAPVFKRVHSTTLGFLAYCEIGPFDFAATDTTPGHAWLTADALRADITAARPQCDFLVVFTHWGIEYQIVQTSDQVNMAHLAIDSGADLVVGCHPHVIQPSEMYSGKPIIYSLGNFVFDYMTDPLTSAGHLLTFSVRGSRLLDWKLVNAYIGDWGQPALV